jgi:hypothetical protein
MFFAAQLLRCEICKMSLPFDAPAPSALPVTALQGLVSELYDSFWRVLSSLRNEIDAAERQNSLRATSDLAEERQLALDQFEGVVERIQNGIRSKDIVWRRIELAHQLRAEIEDRRRILAQIRTALSIAQELVTDE